MPFNAQLATIQPFTTHHEEIFQAAARHTAERLADTWKIYISEPTKCKFFATSVDILGPQITPDGRRPTSKGIEAIINLPSPKNTTELKKFLGMVGFPREYIRNMSARTLHLPSLLKKGIRFQWDEIHEAEFNDLKQAITSPDILFLHPRFDLEFEIHTDASRIGMGAMLAQNINGKLGPIRYVSKAFTETESRWKTQHQELYAIKFALEFFRPYVIDKRIKIVTDNANLQFLKSVKPQQAKLASWCLAMSEFDFYIEHRPGRNNPIPDYLSIRLS